MKILKEAHHSPMFLPMALVGRMHLSCTVMVYFDLDDPETPLPDKEMWPQVMKLLPQPPVLDTGQPKPRAEVLCAGKCFAPDGKPRQAAKVSVAVGGVRKTLDVFGDRQWIMAGNTAAGISGPKPFSVMPLTWERAFGGKDDPRNTKGTGAFPKQPDGKPVPLPNVEYPGQTIGSPSDRPAPASFLPLDVMHPDRQKKAGTYDDKWKTERWPYYPDDLNPEFFLGSAPDQWAEGYFKGGEAIEIVNMHPTRQVITSRAPQFKVRLFLTRKADPKAPPEKDTFEEVPLRIDTLWLFPEAVRGVAVFRGVFNTDRDDMADLRYVYLATEAMGEAPKDLAYYLEAQNRRVAAMKPVKPEIPDVNKKVNRELLKFNRVKKEIAQAKAAAMGLTPVMPREPEEMAAMGRKVIDGGMATLDRMEAMARQFQERFGWRAALDPASFAPRRAKLQETAARMDQAAAKAGQTKAKLMSMKDQMKADMGKHLKANVSPEHLAKAGVDPDNPLPEKDDGLGLWHQQAFPFAVACRRNLENDPALTGRLRSMGFTSRTIAASWAGFNPAPSVQEGADWGLPPGAFTIPKGLVLPRFEGKKLTRILVLEQWPGPETKPDAARLAPGSDAAQQWLAAPDEIAPVIVTSSELDARLMEQEAGEVCHVLALPGPDAAPPGEAAKALKAAPAVLVVAPAGSHENLSSAAPYAALSGKAQWLALPKGAGCTEAAAAGTDLRELVFDALPPSMIGIPEDEPAPAYGPAPPRKRPAMPDIAGLIQAAQAEARAFHTARFAGLKDSMKGMEDQFRQILAKQGQDLDQIKAQALSEPRKGFDQVGQEMAAHITARRDALKAQGLLPADKEAGMTRAAAQARQLGADSEARWQDGQKQLAEAAKKIEAVKQAKPGEVPEEMKAAFRDAGMDLDAMQARTREEVIGMHATGASLSQANLSGVDLSELDLSGADFTGCRLTGANFRNARLDGCVFARAMAQNADFSGASLKGAGFNQAMLNKTAFRKAVLAGANLKQASFNQADLTGADLSGADMTMASMNKANLTGAVFAGASMRLTAIQESLADQALFREARMERVLIRKTSLSGADFTAAELTCSQIQQSRGEKVRFAKARLHKGALAECEFPQCDFTGVAASTVNIRGSNLGGSDFRGATLSRCRVDGSDLTRCRMRGVRARGTSFPGSNLEGADVSGADLLGGSLAKTRIVNADLRGSNCFGVDFHKAVVGRTRFDGANLKLTALHGKADLLE